MTAAELKPLHIYIHALTSPPHDCLLCVLLPDTLLPMLTVEEMLLYTAELKRPWREPLCEKRDDVNMVLDRLALASCR